MAQCPYCQKEVSADIIYCPHCEKNLTTDVYTRSVTTGGMWGMVVLFGLILFLVIKISTSGGYFYDKGYQDGSKEMKNETLFLLSKKYQEGYADGLNIAWYFDRGCEDKVNQVSPQYPGEKKYMEGYNFC
ncbi:MAG: hypothetical protein KBD53_02865 [Candidatus Omnitrophica bacterium]|nr:hypothetical protein [Candidatus Omnitrophota bacterium]